MHPLIKILIVEDQIEIRESIRIAIRTIRDYSLEFEEAGNGLIALEILKKGFIPDVIISDVMMPTMDGFEFCQKVKESHLWCTIPFIFLTARVEVSGHETGLQIGAVGYIDKPFDPRVLGASVRSQVLAYWQVKDQLSNSVNTLLGVFSHETGTALNIIQGFTDLLLESTPAESEQYSWLKNIHNNAKRLENLRRKSALLIELQHKDSLFFEFANMTNMINFSIESCELELEKKSITIKREIEVDLEMKIHRTFLIESFIIVLENAIDFSPVNGAITIKLVQRDSDAVVTIKDEGEGVPADRSLEIFDPYVTIPNVLNHQKGTGLSLAIAKRITELNMGSLRAIPTENEQTGGLFEFCFSQPSYITK